jgi:hypothetical protein
VAYAAAIKASRNVESAKTIVDEIPNAKSDGELLAESVEIF